MEKLSDIHWTVLKATEW